jgi:hypothetical protein
MEFLLLLISAIILSIVYIIEFAPKNFPFYSIYGIEDKSRTWEKHQWVRYLDVFILGPTAIWLGYKLQKDEKSWGVIPYLLYAYAFGTIVYNFANLYRNISSN